LHLEALETRTLLSTANLAGLAALPDARVSPALTQPTPQGLTPAQVRHAYGLDQITFSQGTIVGDGTGQTIAIVDAYSDPNIASDLHTFDQTFQLPDPSLTRVVQTLGNRTPSTNANWALETALDVEWAHAAAPGANILLVEAYSSTLSNLLSAVDYARSQAGVSVVSMSWGSSEFSSETGADGHFTTPTGHSGVTFVASSGDNGAPASWPAFSPNVLAVGGTTLTLDASNAWSNETGWSGSGGGISTYETQPSYQSSITLGGAARTNPDVALNADPNTGYSVYDSVRLNGVSGWFVVGGTSASAPQWAGIIAVADQGLQLAGHDTLDGRSQTLPLLYAVSSSDFHDITVGNNGYSAGPGYDLVTGLGSPIAPSIVQDLVNAVAPQPLAAPTTTISSSAGTVASVTKSATTHVPSLPPAAPPVAPTPPASSDNHVIVDPISSLIPQALSGGLGAPALPLARSSGSPSVSLPAVGVNGTMPSSLFSPVPVSSRLSPSVPQENSGPVMEEPSDPLMPPALPREEEEPAVEPLPASEDAFPAEMMGEACDAYFAEGPAVGDGLPALPALEGMPLSATKLAAAVAGLVGLVGSPFGETRKPATSGSVSLARAAGSRTSKLL
jgi:hypothetical protein